MGIAEKIGCGITTLDITDRCSLEEIELHGTGLLRNVLGGLVGIHYTACPESTQSLTCAERGLHNEAIRNLLRTCGQLDDLELIVQPDIEVMFTEQSLSLTSELVTGVTMASLQTLSLEHMFLRLEQFIDILTSHATDLELLILQGIVILHDGPPWMEVLQCLRVNCKIKWILLNKVTWNDTSLGELYYVKFRLSDDDEAELLTKMDDYLVEDAGVFLEVNLKHGLSYTPWV